MAKSEHLKPKIGIRAKLLAGFFLVLAFVTGAGVTTDIMLERITSHTDFILVASSLGLEVSENLKQSVYKIQHLTVEYAITGESEAAEAARKWAGDFNAYLRSVPAKCQRCHEKALGVSDDSIGTAKIGEISVKFREFMDSGDRLVSAMKDSGVSSGGGAIESYEQSAENLIAEIHTLSAMSKRYQESYSEAMKGFASLAIALTRWGTVLALAVGLALALIASKRISTSLRKVTDAAQRIAGGILSDDDLAKESNDEMGTLTVALNKMRQALRNTIGGLTNSGEMVSDASDKLSDTVGTIKSNIEELSRRAENVATSTTEMSQTVLDIAQNASSIASRANEAMSTARGGAEVVGKTVQEVQDISRAVKESSDVMDSLGKRSNQIGEIVGVINDIADQTNLLALNAAIEAARAGEQGRGFAVVADEVRKLAERTGKATTEISGMIISIQKETAQAVRAMEQSQSRVRSGTELAGKAETALKDIVDSVKGLMEMVQQIASSTEEMSATAEMISAELESMATDSHKTDALTADISRAAGDMMKLSKHLRALSDSFEI